MDWPDGRQRCRWANPKNERYVRYHDEEWGVPLHDDGRLFELLVFECFQPGLSWECVLNKREAFRRAFDNFDLEAVCAYDEAKCRALLADPGIIRNERKIRAAVGNARVFRQIRQACGSFAAYLWGWTDGRVLHECGATRSPLSDAVSRDLTRRGMRFTGTVVVYSFLQAAGVISSHEPGCFLAQPAAGAPPGGRPGR